jgi:hypothetical protein
MKVLFWIAAITPVAMLLACIALIIWANQYGLADFPFASHPR